jgi:hypothetical protein
MCGPSTGAQEVHNTIFKATAPDANHPQSRCMAMQELVTSPGRQHQGNVHTVTLPSTWPTQQTEQARKACCMQNPSSLDVQANQNWVVEMAALLLHL